MPVTELHKKKLKKNLLVLAIIFGICVLIWAVTMVKIDSANAAGVQHCGIASSYDLSMNHMPPVCDIYSRQLQYRDEAIKLRQQIQARAIAFSEPRAALYAQYRKNLDALHETISEDNIPTFFTTYAED